MLLPVVGRLASSGVASAHASHHGDHAQHIAEASAGALLPTADLLAMAVLRHAWLNLDLMWAGALVAAGVISLVI